jgi:hypothetical protein
MYQSKYLKYKNKYLVLKNIVYPIINLIQKGGTPEFDTLANSCLEQIKNNNADCTNCYFFHSNVQNSQTHTSKKCFPQILPVYFYDKSDNIDVIKKFLNKEDANIDNFKHYNMLEYFDEIDVNLDSFLKPSEYNNVSSYTVASNIITINKYQSDVSTFCGEGNIVWVSKNSRVGTTGITSCLFVLMILDDDSKLCIHHTLGDTLENGFDAENGPQKNYTHKSYLSQILTQIKAKIKINNIFYLGSNSLEDRSYNEIIEIYHNIVKIEPTKAGNDGNYIIDHQNNLLVLQQIY